MIISQNSEFRIMNLLAREWFREFSAYELAHESMISVPMVYKTIKKFLFFGLISNKKNKIKINLNNLFSYNFKILCDSERIYNLSKDMQEKIFFVFNIFKEEYSNNLLSFLVFGSVASNETTEKSDIDFLVIVKKKKEIDYKKRGLLKIGKINLIEKEKNEFESDYLLADELVLNALMNGIIVFDSGFVRFFLVKPLPEPSYESVMQKKERLTALKERLLILLKDKDYKNLVEQFKLYIIEKARVSLLEKGIIPRSKKFIISQLKEIDKNFYNFYKRANKRNIAQLIEKL